MRNHPSLSHAGIEPAASRCLLSYFTISPSFRRGTKSSGVQSAGSKVYTPFQSLELINRPPYIRGVRRASERRARDCVAAASGANASERCSNTGVSVVCAVPTRAARDVLTFAAVARLRESRGRWFPSPPPPPPRSRSATRSSPRCSSRSWRWRTPPRCSRDATPWGSSSCSSARTRCSR